MGQSKKLGQFIKKIRSYTNVRPNHIFIKKQGGEGINKFVLINYKFIIMLKALTNLKNLDVFSTGFVV